MEDVASAPYEFVKQQMKSNNHRPSYVSRILEKHSPTDLPTLEQETDGDCAKWSAATLYGASVETTSSSMSALILAMILFPEVQRKAQHEIDSVISRGRLPRLEDQDNLPYIKSIVTENLRWCTVIPMGLPHATLEDVFYKDYVIPKGSYILTAAWSMCHDPDTYPDPDSFDPDRYSRGQPDPRDVMFGYGRRICPGRFLADSSIFIKAALLLAAFNINKAVDQDGKEIDVHLETVPAITARPKDFPYSITPRTPGHAELIKNMDIDHSLHADGDAKLLDIAASKAKEELLGGFSGESSRANTISVV